MPNLARRREPSEIETELASQQEEMAIVDAILGATPACALVVSAPDGKIVRVSDYAVQLTGMPKAELEGTSLGELVDKVQLCDVAGRRLAPDEAPLARALRGETVLGFDGWLTHASGEPVPFVSNAAPIRNARGESIGAINSVLELRPYKALEERLRDTLDQSEILYRELTHRVKNHLQIMSGLIRFEARDAALSAPDLADQMGARLRTLSAVYDGMTRAEAGAAVEARPFVEAICRLCRSEAVTVNVSVEPADIALTSDQAGPLGMLLNEAVCNSIKHAPPGRRSQIWVTLRRVGLAGLHVEVNDNGEGLRASAARPKSHGLELMRVLAGQLDGVFSLTDRPGGGARLTVDLPLAS